MLSPPINLTPRQWELGYLAKDKGAALTFSKKSQTRRRGITVSLVIGRENVYR